MKNDFVQVSKDYSRIEKAIAYLGENFQQQPSLRQVAENIHVSEYHFQRLFQRWAGITPKKFLQYLTKEYAKELLKDTSVLDATYAAGLSSPSRLHDLFINYEAMSPGEYKQMARGLNINYGFHPTPLGECFIAITTRGLCELSFIEKTQKKDILESFHKSWKNAQIGLDQEQTRNYVKMIFGPKKKEGPIHLLCKGTNFQIKVWEALLKIPSGRVVTYKTIAQMIGHPQAVRAVGNAVGKNSIAYLIPCHRVIREAGHLGGYRWGVARKRVILGMEAASRNDSLD